MEGIYNQRCSGGQIEREKREGVGAEIIDIRVNRKREEMYRRWLVESGQCRYIRRGSTRIGIFYRDIEILI